MIFFTSDQHYSHKNIIQYSNRPFSCIEEMNEELVRRHNEVVSSIDTVFHLGDFSLHHRNVTEYLPRLKGEHHLIVGNHDHCHPVHYKNNLEKKERFLKIYRDAGFKSISIEDEMVFVSLKERVKFHHMPYYADHTQEVRYKEFRPVDTGQWLLHGHIHDLWKTREKMINVGVDVWDYRPVSIEQIKAIMASK